MALTLDLIIATHNRATLLRKCLQSVHEAQRPLACSVRVVVVDNASKDDTAQVVSAFAESTDLPVQYLFVARPGKSAALNEAIAATHGELIGLIDDDEKLDRQWFNVVQREFAADPALDFIGGPYLPDWEAPSPDWLPTNYRGAIGIMPAPQRAPYQEGTGTMLMGGNAVMRRSTLQRALPYPEHLGKIGKRIRSGEDEVMFYRLLALGARGMQVPDLIIYHWIPAERLTRAYFRRWVVGRGIAQGWQFRERGFAERSLFGLPRYLLGASLRAIPQWIRNRSAPEQFTAELTMIDGLAMLYGRYSKSR